MSNFHQFPVLQSGFISFTNPELKQHQIEKNPYRDNVLNNTHMAGKNTFMYSPSVNYLYSLFASDNYTARSFELREKALIAAKVSFATTDFMKWLILQKSSKTIGGPHSDFIADTLKFINTGVRNTSAEIWFRNVSALPQSTSTRGSVNLTEAIAKSDLYEHNLNSVLVKWTSRRGGVEDLISTLNIIFGERTEIVDVSRPLSYS